MDEGREMNKEKWITLNHAVGLIANDNLPDAITFTLNEDRETYSLDATFKNVNVNGENNTVIFHSDKVSYPKYTDIYMYGPDEKVLYDIYIPDEEGE